MGTRIAKGMWILTFHSACVRILRREHAHLGMPSIFTIYDEGDTERVIAMVEKRHGPRSEAVPGPADRPR